MKKIAITILCLLSLFVLALAGTVSAYNDAYTHTNYLGSTNPVIDGTYTADDEGWVASGTEYFGDNAIFRDQWTMGEGTWACLLIETEDDTNDDDDQWVICYDSTENGSDTEPDGGPAPTAYDFKLVITGHGASETVEWFRGTGTTWTAVTTAPNSTIFEYAQALTETPKIEADHYVLELRIEKTDTATFGTTIMGYNWGQFVSYYDADSGETQQWPPADATPAGSADNPDSWGYITWEYGANPEPDIPETTSLIAIATVSAVATAGALALRKRRK